MSIPVRVFVSSTWQDLQPERNAVEAALHRMEDAAFNGMEYFGSRPETPSEVSLAEVARSGVYIGIFAHYYGSGITGAEYHKAQECGIPCLIYFKDDSVPVPPTDIERDPAKAIKLKDLKRSLKARHTVSFFNTPDQLATQVVTDLHNLLGNALTVRDKEPSQHGSKYQISITSGQGVVIGDQTAVTQVFGGTNASTPPSPPSRPKPWLVRVNGDPRVYLIDHNGTRHWIPDGPTLERAAQWEDVEPLMSWDEMQRFPPGRPLSGIGQATKPWLVRVQSESEIYLIDEHEIRHRLDPAALGSIHQQTDVDILVSRSELERFEPGEPLSEGLPMRVVKPAHPSVGAFSEVMGLRLQHLADNIRQDMALLKDYEDALRYEDDPLRRARYRREIEQLRESAARYQREYDELGALVTGEPPAAMQDVAAQLQCIHAELDLLLAGQATIQDSLGDLRHIVLARFDASEQTTIAAIVKHLDERQLATVQSVLEALEAGRLSEAEMTQLLDAVARSFTTLQGYGVTLPGEQDVADAIALHTLGVKHKLKVTLPIIPLLVGYEGELELGSGVNLGAMWQRLVARARGG